MRRPLLTLLLAAVLTSGFLVGGATPAHAETTAVTIAGSLQSELGCSADWQPDCAATHLSPLPGTSTWQARFRVPAGSWEFKVALNDSWTVNYGAGGLAGGANIPLNLVGAADLEFSFDADSHRIGVQPLSLGGATTPADRKLAQNSLRQPLTAERYYFLMADRFANGDPSNDSGGLTGGRLDTGFDPADKGFYHGGDLKGVIGKLDYIKGLGTTAIWLTPFLGNHDMGRLSYLLRSGGISDDADLLKRVQLADALMYLTRGQPITYYGDEQGFIGAGGDKDARQDMFATQTAQYASEDVLGGSSGSKDRFDTSAPLYRSIRGLARLRAANPALSDGAQVHRYASAKAGIYAFSRVDRKTGAEYVVALNNATTAKTATFATFNAHARFTALYGARGSLRTARDARITLTVPALSAVVYKTDSHLDISRRPLAVTVTAPAPGGVVGGRAEISAELNTDEFAQASFWFRPIGTSAWQRLGTDDSAPYRVFHDVSGYPAGTLLEYRVVVKDAAGRIAASSSYGIVGTPEASGGDAGTVGPVTQPSAVSVPGDLNSEMGCDGDWDPACAAAQLTLDAKDQIWKGTYTLPAGSYAYKAAIDKTWDENYGANAVKNGSNISVKLTGAPTTFYYDHRTHWVTSDVEGPIITAPGSWNSELGCGGDWTPDCMRPWLEDPDGDGTYTWATSELPAGSYEFKVAHNLGWDESYPSGNVTVTVPSGGMIVRVSYVLATHAVSTAVTRPVTEPSLDSVRGTWVTRNLIAWPADALPVDPSRLTFRLAWGAPGELAVDAEDITGGRSAVVRYDPRGLPDSVVATHPELAGQLALQVERDTSRLLPGIASGEVALGVYWGGRLVDAGLVDTSPVG